jgi:hypothetical protein
MDVLILFTVGIAAGFINVLAGGGSLITLPVMVFLGMEGPVANGTNRVAIAVQNVAAVSGFARQGFSDWPQSLRFAACAVPGAVVGAWVGTQLTGVWFNRLLATVMIAVLIVMARGSSGGRPAEKSERTVRRQSLTYAGMVAVGFYGGFIQAGVGFLIMAALHRGWGLDLVRVNMHKVFIILIYTIPALLVFMVHGSVWWTMGIALAAGNATGAWLASIAAVKKGDPFIRAILFIALIAMAVKLVIGA